MTALTFQLRADNPAGPQPMADLAVLVRRMTRGADRQAAFAELYGRLYGLVVDYAGWLLTEPGAADRAARGAFVQAWHRAHQYRSADGGVEGWILAITHSQIGEARRMVQQNPATGQRSSGRCSLPLDLWVDVCQTGSCYDEHVAGELAGLLTPTPPAPRTRRPALRPSIRRQVVRRTAYIDKLL
jgi:DNA-directed RNA polymerase specialized sigma24 family protein